jgi:hypothetical protein
MPTAQRPDLRLWTIFGRYDPSGLGFPVMRAPAEQGPTTNFRTAVSQKRSARLAVPPAARRSHPVEVLREVGRAICPSMKGLNGYQKRSGRPKMATAGRQLTPPKRAWLLKRGERPEPDVKFLSRAQWPEGQGAATGRDPHEAGRHFPPEPWAYGESGASSEREFNGEER